MKDRITDHRVGVTVNGVERFMNGELLDEIVDELRNQDVKNRLETFIESLAKPSAAIVQSNSKQKR
jgi:protein subunit release factor A